jgi:cysteine desulfurase / selenocysteine lyase
VATFARTWGSSACSHVLANARIYLDNAATSWPKPPAVYEAVDHYLRNVGVAAGRGAYREAIEVERLVLDTRRKVAQLVGLADPRRVIFTLNGTDSLNLALHGLLRPGDHVITSVAEHNSTLRPLRFLESRQGLEVTRVPCDAAGLVDVDAYRRAIRPNTRLLTLVHASNVTGAIQPIAEIARLAKDHGKLFLVDAAQSLGHLPIDIGETPIDLLAAPGHKGLLGPLGTGVLIVANQVELQLEPVRQGGTGTHSESDVQPESLPDRYESGNVNVPGIVGLGCGVQYLVERGLETLRQHEMDLTDQLLTALATIPKATVYGPRNATQRLGVVSFNLAGYDPQEVAALLDASHAIQARSGLHCAPLMHATLRTAALGGTVRLSVGPFTTRDEMDVAIRAIEEIAAA